MCNVCSCDPVDIDPASVVLLSAAVTVLLHTSLFIMREQYAPNIAAMWLTDAVLVMTSDAVLVVIFYCCGN